MDLGNELKQLVDDGIFDWMNESIAHNPSALPRHCIDTNGGLRKDLLRPAPQAYRESLSLAGQCVENESFEM